MKVIEGLVLSNQEYKDSDGIIKLMEKHQITSVFCKGTAKASSKNRALCNPFSLVQLELMENNQSDMEYLIKGKVLDYYYRIQENLLLSAAAFVFRDIFVQIQIVPKYYFGFMRFLGYAQIPDEKKAVTAACFLLKLILEENGISPYVDGCIKCHSTSNIETISLKEGGFLCSNCSYGLKKFSRNKLRAYRILFKAAPSQFDKIKDMEELEISDFVFLAQWLEQNLEIRLKSLPFLISVAAMEN